MAIQLKDKVILITGASSGFGEDAARLFAAEGALVVLAARRIERMQEQVALIQAAGGKALAIPVDISNRADIEIMVQTVIENFGQIDVLFNNAGFGRLNWLDELDPEDDIQAQINVNLTGLIQTTRAVLPSMLARRSGHIINMCSVAGWIAAPMYSIYAATKFGVRGFTDGLRREVDIYGIRVSGIYPGPAVTEFGKHTGTSFQKKFLKTPGWIYMTSEQVARQVVELAKHPRRTVILPWWFHPVLWAEANFPGGVDWVVERFFVSKYRQP